MASRITIELGPGPLIAIGLMSGTSHDGVSAALVRIDESQRPIASLLKFRSYPYAPVFRARLLHASSGERVGAGEISALNFGLGRALAHAAVNVTRLAGVPPQDVSFIGSHGHTFFHLPPGRARRGEIPSTLQLGEPAVIAALSGMPVVADFRPMDMALGGEAAPLAPLAHLRLFGDATRGRVIQNIGGIANATYLPPSASADDARLLAFDTGPGNMLIDALAMKLSRGRLKMDRDGRIAARGRIDARLLAHLMRNPYFRRKPPKSTGREEFGASFLARTQRRAKALRIAGPDLMATLTALTAHSIADACDRFLKPLGPIDQLIVAGGGARNPTLMAMLGDAMPAVEVMRAEALGVDGDALEAIAFALLAYETLRGHPGNIPAVTGARAPAILGKLTLPPTPRR